RMLYGRTSVNRPSRFVGELPTECVTGKKSESVYIPPSLDFDSKKNYESYRQKTAPMPKPSNTPAPEFKKGEMVNHSVFGDGMVLSVLPMGNDALLEIAFDQVGTKKLMAKTAGKHMKKR
ncbi:MAG: ATP-dependent DNA helicase PcrA, partial [Eubacteriales bacterium]